jgi:hypothetical protein
MIHERVKVLQSFTLLLYILSKSCIDLSPMHTDAVAGPSRQPKVQERSIRLVVPQHVESDKEEALNDGRTCVGRQLAHCNFSGSMVISICKLLIVVLHAN